MRLRAALCLVVLPVVAAAFVLRGPVRAQDDFPFLEESGNDDEPRTDDSTPAYEAARGLQARGRWRSAQKAFAKLLEEFPDSVHGEEARLRSEPNHFAGVTSLWQGGPSERRIDVAVMGDGFTYAAKDQKEQAKWARLCLKVLESEAAFERYRPYFNYWFVRLVSEDEKVDPNLTDAQKARIDEKNRRRSNKRKYDYSTALDCKAAGPQGQVMADRSLVYKWLGVADREAPGCGDDGIVIAFARWGKLGMGGGGVANVGRPDKSITVHEFGHAFCGLLDEYTNRPGPPRFAVRAPNATSDTEDVPWQHFLDAKTKGVDVIEGGATFKMGVWRPAASCAMNAAGATGFCPVCREASVLSIYKYVSPIDETSHEDDTEITTTVGSDDVVAVRPMAPDGHELEVTWWVAPRAAITKGGKKKPEDGLLLRRGPPSFRGWNRGGRAFADRTEYARPPRGEESELGRERKQRRGEPRWIDFPLGELPAGESASRQRCATRSSGC